MTAQICSKTIDLLCEIEHTRDMPTANATHHASQTKEDILAELHQARQEITALQKENASLRQWEAKHRALLEILPLGVMVSDANGAIIDVNKASESILGLAAGDQKKRFLNGKNWRIVRPDGSAMPAEEFPGVKALQNRAIISNCEMGVLRPGGKTAWLDVSAAPLDLEGFGALVVYEDISDRKAALEQAKQKESRYKLAVEAGKVGVWEWEMQTGQMYVDPLLKQLLGFAEDEIGNHVDDWSEHIHPEDRKQLNDLLNDYLASGAADFEAEHRMLHRDGSILWILSRGAVVRDHQGRPCTVTGTVLDITLRKQAEEALAQERGRLFTLLERLPAYVCLIGADYSLKFTNRFFRDEFAGPLNQPCYMLMAGRSAPCGVCPTLEVLETGSLTVWEWENSHTGKTYQIYDYPFREPDGAQSVLELGIDITARINAQRALEHSEERYRSIADNLPLGVVIISPDLEVTAVNPRAEEWFGPELAEASHDCNSLFCNAEADSAAGHSDRGHPCEDTFASGSIHERQLLIPLMDGQTRTFQATFCPIFNHSGGVAAVMAILDDVTEKLLIQTQLQRAQKLEALGAMAGGIAHEINQPLNALQLYAGGLEMLLEREDALEKPVVMERLQCVLAEAKKISDIITHMRVLVHQSSSTGERATDINRAVQRALDVVKEQLGVHKIHVETNLQQDLPPVYANPVQLEQVVVNLVVNAMQALDAREPDLATELASPRCICLRTYIRGDKACLETEDNGPGLQADAHRIFDPFYTTKDVGKGMGLGLSIVHTFVRSWRGEVEACNRSEGGARFTVALRRADQDQTHPQGE